MVQWTIPNTEIFMHRAEDSPLRSPDRDRVHVLVARRQPARSLGDWFLHSVLEPVKSTPPGIESRKPLPTRAASV